MPNGVVRKEGLEPPYLFRYQILSLARLPVPPLSLSLQTSRGWGKWERNSFAVMGAAVPGQAL